MNWFKHDTDASTDAKIKKLLIRHGAIGYAVYFHCLELIMGDVSETKVTFELEHDSEIIADNLHIKGDSEHSGREIVENIMRTIIDLGLFEENNGHIFCMKLLKRLDLSMTSNARLRKLIDEAKQNHDTVMIHHDTVMALPDKIMQDKIRKEEKRKEEIRQDNNSHKAKNSKSELFDMISSFTENETLRKLLSSWLKERLQDSRMSKESLELNLSMLKQYGNGDEQKMINKVSERLAAGHRALIYSNDLKQNTSEQKIKCPTFMNDFEHIPQNGVF